MSEPTKPPYVLPSMEAIARVRGTTGLKVVSTFSGCGGSCLGFEQAGFEVVWASEFIDAARDTYRANHPHTILDGRDIREVKGSEILAAIGMKRGEIDVLNGSPPCASFSSAGKREKGWGQVKKYSDKSQRTDDLFDEYIRLVDELRPKVFVAENVAGLVRGTAIGYFKLIMRRLTALGYRVSCRVLDAQWLGVPQSRARTIFVGVRDDLGHSPVHPKPFKYQYSLREAIPWIAKVVHDTSGLFSVGDVTDRPSPAITVSGDAASIHFSEVYDEPKLIYTSGFRGGEDLSVDAPSPCVMADGIGGSSKYQLLLENADEYDSEEAASMDGYAVGVEYDKLRSGEQSKKYFNLVRASEDEVLPCITASGGASSIASVAHPTQRRKFTIRELRRICAFPDDFVLTGSYKQQWERLGRAVPPRMMFHVARTIRDEVFGPLGLVRPDFVEAD